MKSRNNNYDLEMLNVRIDRRGWPRTTGKGINLSDYEFNVHQPDTFYTKVFSDKVNNNVSVKRKKRKRR